MRRTNMNNIIQKASELKKLLRENPIFALEEADTNTLVHWYGRRCYKEVWTLSHKLRKKLEEKANLPHFHNIKRVIIFSNYAECQKYIDSNINFRLEQYPETIYPIIIAMATSDSLIRHDFKLMKFYNNAKKAKDEELMEAFEIAKTWRSLLHNHKAIRQEYQELVNK